MKNFKFISMIALIIMAFAFSAFAKEKPANNSDFMESETPRVVIIADSNPAAETIRQIIAENFGDAEIAIVVSSADYETSLTNETIGFRSEPWDALPILSAQMRETFYLAEHNSHFDNKYLQLDRRTQLFNARRKALNFKPKPEIERMV